MVAAAAPDVATYPNPSPVIATGPPKKPPFPPVMPPLTKRFVSNWAKFITCKVSIFPEPAAKLENVAPETSMTARESRLMFATYA